MGRVSKVFGRLSSSLIGGQILELTVGYLTSEEGRQQIVALGKAAGAAATDAAAKVNRAMPWYRDLEAEYQALANAVEQVSHDIATADSQAPVDAWTAQLQRITTAIPQAHAAIGRDELKRVKEILKNTRALQDEIYRYTMGQAPKAKPRIALPKVGKKA